MEKTPNSPKIRQLNLYLFTAQIVDLIAGEASGENSIYFTCSGQFWDFGLVASKTASSAYLHMTCKIEIENLIVLM